MKFTMKQALVVVLMILAVVLGVVRVVRAEDGVIVAPTPRPAPVTIAPSKTPKRVYTNADVGGVAPSDDPGTAPSSDPSDASGTWKYGFRDLRFETKLEDVKGLTRAGQGADLIFYRRYVDMNRLGAATLSGIDWAFWDGRLFGVVLSTDSEMDSAAMLEAVEAVYGPGQKTDQYQEKYRWTGDSVVMQYDRTFSTAILWIVSIPMQQERENARAQAAAKAGSDF